MNRRLRYIVVGLGAFAVGLLDATVGVVPLALDRTLVNLIGIVALFFAYRIGKQRWDAAPAGTDTPDPELAAGTSAPGEDLRDALAQIAGVASGGYRPLVHDALADLAVGALVRYTPIDGTAATASVRDGGWTDNPLAAKLVGVGTVRSTRWSRVRRHLTDESVYERAVRETVAEIARIAGVESSSGSGPAVLARIRKTEPDRPRTVSRPDRAAVTDEDNAAGAGTEGETVDGRSRPTGRWRGAGALALVGVAAGVIYEVPGLVLAGVVVVGVAAYGRTGTAPPIDLRIERDLEEDHPAAGDRVTVTLRVHNESGAVCPDLRLVDGVPDALRVDAGSPRLATALGPDGTATVTYTVVAKRGTHEFGPTLAICRDLAGTAERAALVDGSGDSDGEDGAAIVCRPEYRVTASRVPLRRHPGSGSGSISTSIGGSGVEFHDTREYRPGDPPSRIDWNRLARTGTLGTTELREERVATVVLVVDARPSAYCSPGGDEHAHALDRAVEAAGRLGVSLLDGGHRVGLVAFGPEGCWLRPGNGRDHHHRFRELLWTHGALSPVPDADSGREQATGAGRVTSSPSRLREAAATAGRERRRRLERRLPDRTQLLVCTPLVDAEAARLVQGLEAGGYPATVVSPDPTVTGTPGRTVARIGRQFRITDLRRAGVPVVDWPWDDSLDAALERHAAVSR